MKEQNEEHTDTQKLKLETEVEGLLLKDPGRSRNKFAQEFALPEVSRVSSFKVEGEPITEGT